MNTWERIARIDDSLNDVKVDLDDPMVQADTMQELVAQVVWELNSLMKDWNEERS